jgi:hypothetical protein
MTLIMHLARALFRAFFRILLSALVFAGIGGGATLLISYQQTGQWPPRTLTEAAAIAIAVLSAYAAALTVLIREAVKGVITVEKGAVQDVEHEVASVEREVTGAKH